MFYYIFSDFYGFFFGLKSYVSVGFFNVGYISKCVFVNIRICLFNFKDFFWSNMDFFVWWNRNKMVVFSLEY